MTPDEYATVRVAVDRALMDLREQFPWCEIKITGKVIHLIDKRPVAESPYQHLPTPGEAMKPTLEDKHAPSCRYFGEGDWVCSKAHEERIRRRDLENEVERLRERARKVPHLHEYIDGYALLQVARVTAEAREHNTLICSELGGACLFREVM